jgi:hypothetical protein
MEQNNLINPLNNLYIFYDCNKYPLSKEYSKFLLSTSYLMSITVVISYLMHDWYTLFFLSMLLFTSINYWRNAAYGIRRYIDITVVMITSCYFVIESIKRQPITNLVIICFYLICIVVFYIFEHIFFYLQNPKWIVMHMTMHIYFIVMVLYYYSHIYLINDEERYKWLNFTTLLFDCLPN